MSPRKPKQTIKQQIIQKHSELDESFDNFSSTKRTCNLYWLRRQIAVEEPKVLYPGHQKDLDDTNMANIAVAYDYIIENAKKPITLEEVCHIHHTLCKNTHLEGFGFRTTTARLQINVNGVPYRAPDSYDIEYNLRQIIYNLNNTKQDVFTRAYNIHYDLIMLQPFNDFNKRTARLIMNWVLLQNGYRPIAFNKREDKHAYIQAICDRANGNKRAYTEYMSKCQLRTQKSILKHLRDSKIY